MKASNIHPGQETDSVQNRRDFIKSAVSLSAAVAAAPAIVTGQGAPRLFKVGMIGSGRRARGAFENLKAAAKSLNVEIRLVATADYFLDQAQMTAKKLGCDEKFSFGGGTSYKKVLETDCDLVILAAPPTFRPVHVAAAVAAGKHIFAEKPVAVDPPGLRQFLAAAAAAKEKKLALVAGTQRRHQAGYLKQALAL